MMIPVRETADQLARQGDRAEQPPSLAAAPGEIESERDSITNAALSAIGCSAEPNTRSLAAPTLMNCPGSARRAQDRDYAIEVVEDVEAGAGLDDCEESDDCSSADQCLVRRSACVPSSTLQSRRGRR